ncbi:hypothetical protein FACS189430_11060 [Bacteroidia bacterium]|nr:hypothetical protein FACS189430_11060 [Bacteroidia bacterium]
MANIKPEQAKMNALTEAKAEALRLAGVSELLTVREGSAIMRQAVSFVQISNSEMMGEITRYRSLKEGIEQAGGRYLYRVTIEATVKTNKVMRDIEFDADISGFKSIYRKGEALRFAVQPSKPCFLHIFWFDENGNGALLFPNHNESAEHLNDSTAYQFPRNDLFNYTLTKDSAEPVEYNVLVFVLTKDKAPFSEKQTVNMETIEHWTMKIPADRRVTKVETLTIGE